MGEDLHWIDSLDIAIALNEAHPEVNPKFIRFTDLHNWVCDLPGFLDMPEQSNEKILEAIQMCWIEERE